jgi:hypothetical protein
MNIFQHRGGLKRTRKALGQDKLTIGFIGGSITEGSMSGWNWPRPVVAWFVENFPNARIVVENAAIGATGSELAVFRAERDLIQRGCDLVFIEYGVNDQAGEKSARTREGLIRKLLKEERDLVLVYTYSQEMYPYMTQGGMPPGIAEFEQLAQHYSLGSVWAGLHAFQEIKVGRMRWDEWLPDGLHPQFRGSFSYGQSVMSFLQRELVSNPSPSPIPSGERLPKPLNPANWEHARMLPFSALQLKGPWIIQRWLKTVWIDQVLYTAAIGAELQLQFEGSGLILGFDFGKTSCEFRYQLDGGEWKISNRDRPDWCGQEGWFRTFSVAEDLPVGKHTLKLEVIHGNATGKEPVPARFSGTNFCLAFVGVIPGGKTQ